MFIAALFAIARTWIQPIFLSIDRKMDKEDVGYIYTMEYYSAIKRNEIKPFAATWVDLEIIIISKLKKRKTNTI